MNQSIQARAAAEDRAVRAMALLLCGVSVWRTGMTRMLPRCGASAWWMMLLCLLPGFAAAGMIRLSMYLTGTHDVTDAIRACAGRWMAAAFSWLLAALLLLDALASMTALITLFTQGVGTRGTQLTMAALTGGMLALALHREGLPRAVFLLGGAIAAIAVLLAALAFCSANPDALFPLMPREGALPGGLSAGASLAWPAVLLLHSRQGKSSSGLIPFFGAVGAVLLTTLLVPRESFVGLSLADCLLLPVRYASNAVRLLWLCLLMLCFFYGIGASVQLAAAQVQSPLSKELPWLPYGLLAVPVLAQGADIPRLWALLGDIQPWLMLALLGMAALLPGMAVIGRQKC